MIRILFLVILVVATSAAQALSVVINSVYHDICGRGGRVQGYVSGGVGPYQLVWSSGQVQTTGFDINLDGLSAGEYTITVTDATFQAEVIDSEIPVVVDIWATLCGPCKQVAPILDQLAAEYDGRVKIVKLDADQNPETVTAVGVTSILTLGFYTGGARVDMLIGAHPKPVIAEKMEALLA